MNENKNIFRYNRKTFVLLDWIKFYCAANRILYLFEFTINRVTKKKYVYEFYLLTVRQIAFLRAIHARLLHKKHKNIKLSIKNFVVIKKFYYSADRWETILCLYADLPCLSFCRILSFESKIIIIHTALYNQCKIFSSWKAFFQQKILNKSYF